MYWNRNELDSVPSTESNLFFLHHKFNWTVSAVLKKKRKEKKRSGAQPEKESVWEAYWLAAPGGKDPPHHTSLQHLPQGIHLNVVWQPSAISKLNLDIDFDFQFRRWKTLLCFHTHSQAYGVFVMLRGTPAEALHRARWKWRPLLPITTCFSKFLGVVCVLLSIKLCIAPTAAQSQEQIWSKCSNGKKRSASVFPQRS